MDPRVVNATALRDEDIEEAEVIILADVQRLPSGIARTISRKVAEGVGLITIAGPRADAGFYNAWEGLDGFVIPMEIGEETTDAAGIQPAPTTFNHEALKIFAGEGDLKEANITRWRKAKPHDEAATQAAAFGNGDTFIAARNYGKGRTLLVTAALDARSGGLPAKRSFVPFIHELTTWAAGRGADLNVDASWNPSVALRSSGGGLLGEYFKGKSDKKKNKSIKRVDAAIDFDWGDNEAFKGMRKDDFYVRWTGRIVAPISGNYRISAWVDDNITVKIEGNAEMRSSEGEHDLGDVTLQAGKPIDITVNFSEGSGRAGVKLYWTPPGGTKEIVPASAFIPGEGENSEPLAVTDPRGAQRKAILRHGRRGEELVVDGSAIPGVYLIFIDEELNKQFPDITDGRLPLVVNRDAGESGFEEMQEDDLALIRSAIDLILPANVQDILAVMDGKGFGREIWKLLAIAALILFIMESILARWVSRSRRAAEDVRVDFGEETTFGGGHR